MRHLTKQDYQRVVIKVFEDAPDLTDQITPGELRDALIKKQCLDPMKAREIAEELGTNHIMCSFRCSPGLRSRIETEAMHQGVSKAHVIRQALAIGLKEMQR